METGRYNYLLLKYLEYPYIVREQYIDIIVHGKKMTRWKADTHTHTPYLIDILSTCTLSTVSSLNGNGQPIPEKFVKFTLELLLKYIV